MPRLRLPARLAVFGALLLALAAGAVAQTTTRLTFLHLNDVYQISPRRGLGGFGPLATLVKQERARSQHALLTFGGDLISPSLLSGITKGAHMIELMNALGTDIAVLGNHEFDFGLEVALKRIGESRFPWLATNVFDRDGKPLPGTVATRTATLGEVKVGFFGTLTPEARLYFRDAAALSFAPVQPHAAAAVEKLRREGVQVIIALTHMSLQEDRDLLRAVPGIHLVLGGHDHIPITVFERGALIVKAGADADFLAIVELEVQVAAGVATVHPPSWRLMPVRGIAADPEVQAIVRRHELTLDREFAQPIGRTETAMDSRAAAVRLREAAIGNLIADAIRLATNADVGLVNGGGIRANKQYPPGSTITRRDIFSEMPFGNTVVVLEITGAGLLGVLEHGFSRAGQEAGIFPQVSGLAVVFDPARPPGQRVKRVSVGGAPLEAGRLYRLATNDFVAGGGDGYAMLADKRRILDANAGPLMAEMVMDYIQRRATVAPRIEGRIVEER
jgi:2',3'-cyclic-nucleotide 2'-phosphodiesterase (5'-nucleotidase family)